MKRHLALVLLLGVAACGPEHIAPPSSPAPSITSPARAIPGDLDVAVRIDLGRMRDALGPNAISMLRSKTPGDVPRAAGDARLYDAAFRHADKVWLAFRPGESLELTDNVVIMKGHFAGIDPQSYGCEPRWEAATDLGAAWRVYDRAPPRLRSAPARIYARADDLLVFVSSAELDSAQRVIEEHADDPRVEPEAKGAISVAARTRALVGAVEDRAPAAARLLARAERLRADADLGAGELHLDVELEFSEESEARRAADAAGLLAKSVEKQGGTLGKVAQAINIEAVGPALSLRLKLGRQALAALLACAGGKGAC